METLFQEDSLSSVREEGKKNGGLKEPIRRWMPLWAPRSVSKPSSQITRTSSSSLTAVLCSDDEETTTHSSQHIEESHPTEIELVLDNSKKTTTVVARRPLLRNRSSLTDNALKHMRSAEYSEALQEINCGMKNPDNEWEWKLLKAEVLGRQGNYRESLKIYRQAITEYEQDPTLGDVVLCARLYFTCGRLSVYLQDYEQAIEYYTMELQHTRAVLKDSVAVARIYHELARVAKNGMGDWERALGYYQQALSVEVEVLNRIRKSRGECQQEEDLADVMAQMRETKRCMGRILFALGRINEAIGMS